MEKDMEDLCYLVDDPAFKIEHLATPASLFNVEPPRSLKSWPTHSIKKFAGLTTSDMLAEYVNGGNSVGLFLYYKIIIAMDPFKGNASLMISEGYNPFLRT
jgi:hypothetical protein